MQYFINGYADGKYFDSDLRKIVRRELAYTIDIESKLLRVNGTSYSLPKGWKKRHEAYDYALNAFK